jgi:hypothetical protein
MTALQAPATDRHLVFRLVPGLQAVRSYRREWLAKDVVAGIVLTTLLVPQGMAYAELAGLPPITGLYTSIMCLLGYAVFGCAGLPDNWLSAAPGGRRSSPTPRASLRSEGDPRWLAPSYVGVSAVNGW